MRSVVEGFIALTFILYPLADRRAKHPARLPWSRTRMRPPSASSRRGAAGCAKPRLLLIRSKARASAPKPPWPHAWSQECGRACGDAAVSNCGAGLWEVVRVWQPFHQNLLHFLSGVYQHSTVWIKPLNPIPIGLPALVIALLITAIKWMKRRCSKSEEESRAFGIVITFIELYCHDEWFSKCSLV